MASDQTRRVPTIEVFADITCPFTHVGVKRVIEHFVDVGQQVALHVRAWPLEWVNGAGMEADAVALKAKALSEQLGVDDFAGFDPDQWPSSTIQALELAANAYAMDVETGLKVSLQLRSELFERGVDIGDPEVLARIASEHDMELPPPGASSAVQADYDEGRRLGVSGSPHFFVGEDNFFCPALDLGHDADGNLIVRLDTDGLAEFFNRVEA